MKPLFVVGGLYHRANGVAWIMRDLAGAMAQAGSPVTIYAADCPRPGLSSIGEIFSSPNCWVSRPGRWLGGLSWSPQLRRELARGIAEADVIHNHSLWMLPNSYASRLGAKARKPVVFTIHGTLEPWALAHSAWKKRLVGYWFQYHDLRTADCLHANSQRELENIRALGYRNPIAVIPNGVNLRDFAALPPKTELSTRYPELKDKKCLLFMARLHKKKGLDHLLEAWQTLAIEFPDWHLVIAGPDDGYLTTCQRLINEFGIDSRTTMAGNLQRLDKLTALAAAGAFVQPSHSEGFSMSIIEAMACRIPVLMSPGCNFPEAAAAGAALEVSADTPATTAGLRQLLGMSDQKRTEMGAAGRRLVEQGYTWDRVAEMMLRLYSWLKRESQRPEHVFL